jgi:hypothetical protein
VLTRAVSFMLWKALLLPLLLLLLLPPVHQHSL